MTDQTPIRVRSEWASALAFSIGQCDPVDASQIIVAALEDMATAGPLPTWSEDPTGDATFWAESAPQHELMAYGEAAMRELSMRALSVKARKRLIATLWNGLDAAGKAQFLAHVRGDI